MGSKCVWVTLGAYCINLAVTSIVYAEVVTDGSLGEATTLGGPNFEISSELGQVRGNNLFHSFNQFNLSSNESANFSGPGNIQNIISRVTGGQSFIDGTISSSINGANLFLLNPSGVLFGANASVDITGSFYVSSAHYMNLGNQGRFDALQPQNTALSVAAPSAFGFISGHDIGRIEINQSHLQVNADQAITVVGGDIDIIGDGSGEANLQAPGGEVNLVSIASAGELDISSTLLDTAQFDQLGEIAIHSGAYINTQADSGGSIVIRGGRLVMDNATTYSSTRGPTNDDPGIGTDIQLSEDLILTNGATIGSNVYGDNASDSSPVTVIAKNIEINNGAKIESSVYAGAPGNSGGVAITAETITLTNGGSIQSLTNGTGDAGNINITAGNIQLANAFLSTTTFSSGNAGDINITAENFSSSGNNRAYWGVFANTWNAGDAGNITMDISNRLSISDYASLQSATFSIGNGGDINLNVGSMEILNGAYLTSAGIFGFGGSAGNVFISANDLSISGVEESDAPFTWDFTGIQTASSSYGGDGGDLTLSVNSLDITNRGLLSTASYGSGQGGELRIDAQTVTLSNGAQIISGAYGSGDGGDIVIHTNDLILSGVNEDPYSDVHAETGVSEIVAATTISSQAGFYGGNAGDAIIRANNVEISDGARISSDTFGGGNGGTIDIEANTLLIEGKNQFLESFLVEREITDAYDAELVAKAGIFANANSTNGNEGNAGMIKLSGNELTIHEGIITTEAEGLGDGGDVNLNFNNISLSNNAIIQSKSTDEGHAGKIKISATQLLSQDSLISTEAYQSHGGDIEMNISQMASLERSRVTTSVAALTGNGGNITIQADTLVVKDSEIKAQAFEGQGGDISIQTNRMLMTPSSTIDASSKKSIDGEIQISPGSDVILGIETLPADYESASRYFHNECDADRNNFSHFSKAHTASIPPYSSHFSPSQFTPSVSVQKIANPEITSITDIASNSAKPSPQEQTIVLTANLVWQSDCRP